MFLRICGGGYMMVKTMTEQRYSESERMHHSLTGREQSPVRSTQYNQQLSVSAEQWGRDQQISLDTQFYYHRHIQEEKFLFGFSFHFAPCYFSNQNYEGFFFIFLVWATVGHRGGGRKKTKLWENPRGSYQQTSEHSFKHQMGQRIKPPPHSAVPEQSFGYLGDTRGVSQRCNSWLNLPPRPGKQRLHKHCPDLQRTRTFCMDTVCEL